MPEGHELEIKVEWKNNQFFRMTKKLDEESWIKVVEIEENSHIAAIAGSLKSLCMADFNAHMDIIMTEMQKS
ncbi:hypothetical protein LCGC14_2028380 [marine sediment metagenome]|uniref:Uncharacterized protein n=1 Tax=marine sediment metagenome TaxID=412755 RepID=A0A0F9EVB0_9ZZZZ